MGAFAEAEAGATVEPLHGVKVGDVFVESWGYDQTNIDVYIVAEVTNTMVGIMEGRFILQPDGWNVKPDPTWRKPFETDPSRSSGRTRIGAVTRKGTIRKRVVVDNYGTWLDMTSYSVARLWDGERVYHDTIAAGQPGH